MAATNKILALSGSSRSASFNRKLLAIGIDAARQAGAEVTQVDLRELRLPIYDGDDEERDGVPAGVLALRDLFARHQGFMIATPEHNGSVTSLLKNALDWCSRPVNGQDGLAPFRGKTAALMAASLSPFGGIRSVTHLRGILNKMGCNVLADEVLVPGAASAFDADGKLLQEAPGKLVVALAGALVRQVQPAPAP